MSYLCDGMNNGCPLPVLCVVPPPGQYFCLASLSVPVVVLCSKIKVVIPLIQPSGLIH